MSSPTLTRLECATDISFVDLIQSYEVPYTTVLSVPVNTFPTGQQLYSRVRHFLDGYGWTDWSATVNFSLSSLDRWVSKWTYGTNTGELRNVVAASDGSIFVSGYYYDVTNNHYQVCIGKVSNNNETFQWLHTFTVSTYATIDGGMVKDSQDNLYLSICTEDNRTIIMKLSSTGTILWQKSLDTTGVLFYCLCLSTDETYLYSAGEYTGDHNAVLFKWSTSTGALIWQKELVNIAGNICAYSIVALSNGNIVMVGIRYSSATTYYAFMASWSSSGNLSWTKYLNLPSCGYKGVSLDPNSGMYYAIGYGIINGSYYAIIVKHKTNGDVQWTRKFLRPTTNVNNTDLFTFCEAVVDNNGAPCVAGGAGQVAYLAKLDSGGGTIWQKSLTLVPAGYNFRSIAMNSLGEYFAAGPVLAKIPNDGTGLGVLPNLTDLTWNLERTAAVQDVEKTTAISLYRISTAYGVTTPTYKASNVVMTTPMSRY